MLKDIFPSMFARRVLLLIVLIIAAGTPLVLQMGRLTLAQGDELRGRAESKLRTTRRVHNTRGSILDRKGRGLATDVASYDIAVDYDVITGHWAFRQAAAEARRSIGSGWRELSPLERLLAAEERLPSHQSRLELSWSRFCE
ncbi:MAG: hypothetical protein ACT4PL_11490, partial [Phycisphaerales bacterium]